METSEGTMGKSRTFLCRVCSKPLQEEVDLLVRTVQSRSTTEEIVILHHSESQMLSLIDALRDVLKESKVSGILINSHRIEDIMIALRDEERGGKRVLKDLLETKPLMVDDQACTCEFDPSILQGTEDCSISQAEIEDIVVSTTQEYLVENGYQLPQHRFRDTSFFKIGLDSLDLMMLAERISERIKVEMELTALIDYPTVDALCTHINTLCDSDASNTTLERSLLPHIPSHIVLGVTGINSNLPTRSKGHVSSFFEDDVTQIPVKRWDMDRHGCADSPTASVQVLTVRFGAFLENIEYFDPTMWDIPVVECEYMDPQQRLLLEAVSGLTFAMGADVVKCGIFVGASTCDYQSLISKRIEAHTATTPFSVTATGLGIIPGRIAFHLGMQGPAIATDTACSSSLVSLSIAHQMTHQQVIKSSFSCGSSLLIDQGQFRAFESANMLAKDGRSKALDASADGFARGEAIVALRLDEISEGIRGVLCVLESIYVNQDGKSSRLTAPNGPAQTALITETLRRSACEPSDVAKFMLHGTGTPLGDPIELGALLKSYQSSSQDTTESLLNLCAIKTSVGHSEAAAGIVSLSGAIAMKSMPIVPVLHLRCLNEHLKCLMESNRDKGPYLSIKRCSAPGNGDRTERNSIGVSSFASQGTNCHAVLSLRHNQSVQVQAEAVMRNLWRKKCLWIFALPETRMKFVCSRYTSALFELPVRFPSPDSLQECFLEVASDAVSVLGGDKQMNESGHGLQGIVYREFLKEKLILFSVRVRVEVDVVAASVDGLQSFFAEAHPCSLLDLSHSTPGSMCPLMPTVKPVASPSAFGSKKLPINFCHSHELALLNWIQLARGDNTGQGPPMLQSLSLCTSCESSGRDGYQTIHEEILLSGKRSLSGYCVGFKRAVPATAEIYYTSNVLVDGCEGGAHEKVSEKYYPLSLHNVDYFVPLSIVECCASFLGSLGFLQQSMSYEKSVGRIGNPLICPNDFPLVWTRHDNTLPKFCYAVSRSFEREAFNGKFAFAGSKGKARSVDNAMSLRSTQPEEDSNAKHLRSNRSLVHYISQMDHHYGHLMHQRKTMPSPWMLSGGTGGLGWLLTTLCAVDHSHVVCVSKSGVLKQTRISDIASIKSDSAVSIERGEVSSHEDIGQIVNDATYKMRTCRFVHAGGILHDSSHRNVSLETFRNMFAPKVSGIHCITKSLLIPSNLQNLIAFSSIAALLHPSGSSIYGAINTIMDTLTSRLPATGMAAVSIQWGPWSSVGMVAKSSKVSGAMNAFGISMLSTEQGLWAFSTLLSMKSSPSLIAVVPFDVRQSRCGATLQEVILSRASSRRLHQMTGPQIGSAEANSIAPRVQSLLTAIIGNRIDSQMESVLKYGADSLCAIEIQQQLSDEFRIELPPSFLYDFPTVHSMTTAIHAILSDKEAYCLTAELKSDLDGQKHQGHLGIKELASREPDGLWGDRFDIECTKIAHFFRWDVDELADNVPEARFGKFLSHIDIFDSGVFGISTLEANLMDPQQRILLEDSLALRCSCTEAQGQAVGVVVGLSFWDYSNLSERHTRSFGDALKLTGRNFSVSSGRISFVHGYSGPSMSVDTACSSSIVAVSIASNLLTSEPLGSVIVGSALISLSIDVMRFLASASMISADGRCRTLDEGAAGYGRGEASVCMLITRSPEGPTAICAVTVNQDGHSASLTAPHGPSQIQVIRRACANAEISPVDVEMHELHGTGTPLGDPIELLGVSKAQEEASNGMTSFLSISTSKTAHGHSEPAAGCIGIRWILRQLEKKIMAPNIHLIEVSKHIESALLASKRPMYPARECRPIGVHEQRAFASLSSFAFQGTNAHAILQYDTSRDTQFRVDALRCMAAYHGHVSWYCSTVHPLMHLISPTFPDQDISWSVGYKQNFISRMKDHKVFSASLLPGMCIFAIMSDAAQLCLAGRADYRHLLRNANIGTPVHLDDAKHSLVAKVSLSTGKATLCVDNGNCSRPNAMCGIWCLSSQGQGPVSMDPRPQVLDTHAKPQTSAPSVGFLAHAVDQKVEMANVPSPELLDGSTHLAAFSETLKGRAVSVPVSSECLSIAFTTLHTSQIGRFQGFASCDDARASDRLRDYYVHLPGTKYTYIKSLYSASIKRERSLEANFYFLNVDHINNTRKARELSDIRHRQRAVHKLITLQGNTTFSSARSHKNPLLEYSTLIEFVRTQNGRSFSYMAPKLLGVSSSSRNSGQLRVANTEIGCNADIIELDPSACRLHTVDSWKEISIPYSPNENTVGPSKNYRSLAAGIAAISGGTEGIGLLLGQWLASGEVETQSSIALVGRTPFLTNSFPQSFSRNIPVTITQHDCATETGTIGIEKLCRACTVGFRANIFHGAGVIFDQTITSTNFGSSLKVFAPKYWGIKRTAARAMSSLAVGSIVSLSSMSITIGNPGQSNYIAANSAMETVSQDIAFTGIDSRIIRYGPWKRIGMLAKKESILKSLSKLGLLPLSPSQGLAATEAFIRSSHLFCTLAHINRETINRGDPFDNQRCNSDSEGCKHSKTINQLSDTRDSYDRVRSIILDILGEVLDEVPSTDDDPFFEIGIDSISSIEIHRRLNKMLQKDIPPTILFDYPTVSKLANALCGHLEIHVAHVLHVDNGGEKDRKVSICGTSQILPNIGLSSIDEFVDLVPSSTDLHSMLPKDRWDFERHFSLSAGGTTAYTGIGAFVPNIWAFDQDFYGLKTNEARQTDPQLRSLLHTTANAIHCSGITDRLRDTTYGVFVGCMFYDYLRIIQGAASGVDAPAVIGNGAPYLCGRIAYTFDMRGPCAGIDTACSSSLVAVDSAYYAILNRQVRHSVACGTNVIICPGTTAMVCQLGALSRYGRCLSLDATADGYGRGEGIVSLNLSADHNENTLASIRATAVNQDGRSISMTAPNGPSQEALLRSCLSKGGLRSDDLDQIVIHGTGTLLGDPIESQALHNLLQGPSFSPTHIAAVKALLGHCEGAAGTVGVLLSVYSACRKSTASIQTLRSMNPLVQNTLKSGKLVPSRAHAPEYATIAGETVSGSSSFGMSGTNANAILSATQVFTPGRHHDTLLKDRMYSFRIFVSESLEFLGHEVQHASDLFEYNASSSTVQVMMNHQITGKTLLLNLGSMELSSFHSAQYLVAKHFGCAGRSIIPASLQIYICFQTLLQTTTTKCDWGMNTFIFYRSFLMSNNLRLLVRHDFAEGSLAILDRATSGLEFSSSRVESLRCRTGWASGASRSSLSQSHVMQNFFSPKITDKCVALISVGGRHVAPILDASFHLGAIHQTDCRIPVSCGSIHFGADPSFNMTKSNFFSSAESSIEYRDQSMYHGCARREHFKSRQMKVKRAQGDLMQQESIWQSTPGFKVLQPGARIKETIASFYQASDPEPLRLVSTSLEMLYGGIATKEDDSIFLSYLYPSNDRQFIRQHPLGACLQRVYNSEANQGLVHPLSGEMASRPFVPFDNVPVQSSLEYPTPSQTAKTPERRGGAILSSLGGIGILLAQYFATMGSDIRSCSRHGVTGSLPLGKGIEIIKADVSHAEDVQFLLCDATLGHGIMHTSGCLRDGLIRSMDLEGLRATLAPKRNSFDLINRYSHGSPRIYVCAFSSIASSFGSIGQAAYAAANQALDAAVCQCSDSGLPSHSIQWGLWGGIGMARGLHAAALKRLSSIGVSSITPIEGLERLEALLSLQNRHHISISMICKIRTDLLEKYLASQPQLTHLLRGIKSHQDFGGLEISRPNEVDRVNQYPEYNIPRTLKLLLCQHVDTGEDDLDLSAPVLQLGFDSVSSVELLQSLEKQFHVHFPASFMYDYVYFDDMVAYIKEKLQMDGLEEHTAVRITPAGQPTKGIQIVCTASLYAGTDDFQGQTLSFGHDCAGPTLRNSPEVHSEVFASTISRRDIFAFDSDLFKLPKTTVVGLDPNIRWMLTLTKELFGRKEAVQRNCGVYLGWMWSHENFHRLQRDGYASQYLASSVTGNSAAFAVGYTSYLFELNGPSIPIDTACSSSLVALHTANQGMQSSDCIDAVILGVNSFLEDQTWTKIEALKALSPDGRSKTFDASADGYGRGEAFTSLHLSSSAQNGTANLVVGTAVNTVGTRSSLTAPHGPSQVDVIRQAQERCGNVPVSGLFLHGTGTSLGDPIEIRALHQALIQSGECGPVALQSPKSSVGHTEGSAGLTNILAALAAMQSQLLMPIHNLRSLNPMIALIPGTASVTRTFRPHSCETPAYSGSNSFGMTGVNSHAIMLHSTGAADHPSSRDMEMGWMSPVGWTQHVLWTGETSNEFHVLPHISRKASFLRDHWVNEQQLLPGTLFIELAKEALALLSQDGFQPLSNISWNVGCIFDDLPGIKLTVEDKGRINVSKRGLRCACTMDCVQTLTQSGDINTRAPSPPWPVPFSHAASDAASYISNSSSENSCRGHPLWFALPMDAILHLGALDSKAMHIPVAMKFFLDRQVLGPPAFISTMPSNTENRKSTGALSLGVTANTISIESHSLVGKAVIQGANNAGRLPPEKMYAEIYNASCPTPQEWESSRAASDNRFVVDGRISVLPLRDAEHPVVGAFQQSMSILRGSIGHHVHLLAPRERFLCLQSSKDAEDTAVQEATLQTFSKEQLGSAVVTRYSDLRAQATSLDHGTVAHKAYQLEDARVAYKSSFIARYWHPGTYFPDQLLNDALPHSGTKTSLGKDLKKFSGYDNMKQGISVNLSAVGLNFRDLLMALGMYPSESTDIGSDFAGFVSSSCFADFKRGDAIFGQALGTFHQEINVDPDTISHIPPSISHEEASGMPTIYLTAMACLKCLTATSEGGSLLIQSAAGGFGIAMTDMARASGMSVVATASTPLRRCFLRARCNHTFNSRTTEFVEEIIARPSLSIKSVVNTLTSLGMVAASCSLLQVGGTFVEVSKRHIFSAHRMLQERNDISHHTVAVDIMPSKALKQDVQQIAKLVALGKIRPCPCTTMPLTRLRQALLRFKSPNNIGKIIWRNKRDDETSGTWLVTGGLGALGMLTISLLVSRGCNIAVPTRTAKSCPTTLRDAHGSVSMQIASISQAGGLREYFKRNQKSVDGIVHSSGILQDALLLDQTLGKAREVFAAKSSTIQILQNIARNEPLSGIVLFSSMSSVFGNIGQANYCSANKVLDISSQKFSQAGHGSFVVNWGPWAGGGMAANINASVLESAGLSLINPKYGIYMIHHFVSTRLESQLSRYVCVSSQTELDQQLATSNKNDGDQQWHRARPPDSSSTKRNTTSFSREFIDREIRSIISSLLERDLDPSAPLMASGLDSLGSIQLVTTLSKTFAIEISSTFPFDHPTMQSMADQIFAMKCAVIRAPRTDIGATGSPIIFPLSKRGLSIVGVYSLLPEVEGHGDAGRVVPFDRWDRDATRSTFKLSNFIRFGGFIASSRIETFDIPLFRMSLGEAKIIDPQQRCLLEGVVSCRGQQAGQDTCVAVGIARLEDPWETIYSTHNLILQGNGMVSTSRAASAAAGRVSYTFDYKGPSLSIDTACSSSLVALKVIEDIVSQKESTEGVLCGVSLPMSVRTSMMLASSSMLARDGRCKTLDASADGYGRSEACLVMKLRPRQLHPSTTGAGGILPQGVIISSAVNQDGASSSLTAPHGPSQEQVLHQGLLNGRITPIQVHVAGMHGTGTPLGDPIEISSLQHKFSTRGIPLTLASSKARYGHAETASGLVGLLCVLGVTNNSSTQNIVNLRYLNPHMTAAFNKESTLHAPRESEPYVLHQDQTGICSISAFAFQGTNACAFVDREPVHPSNGGFFHSADEGLNLLSQQADIAGPKCHRLVARILVNKLNEPAFICGNAAPALQLMDHVVNGRSTLPAAGVIHLVQTAVDSLRYDDSLTLLSNLNFKNVKLLSARKAIDMVVKVRAGRISVTEERDHVITELCSAQVARLTKRSVPRGESHHLNAGGTRTSKTRVGGIILATRPDSTSYGLIDSRCAEFVHSLDSNWHLLAATQSTPEDLHIPSTVNVFQQDTARDWHRHIGHASLRQLPNPSFDGVKFISSALRCEEGELLHLRAHSMALRRIHQIKHAKSQPLLLSLEARVLEPFDYRVQSCSNPTSLMTPRGALAASLSAQMCTILQALQTNGHRVWSNTSFLSSDAATGCHVCCNDNAGRVNLAALGSIKELPGFERLQSNEPYTRAMIDVPGDPDNKLSRSYSKFDVIITGGAGGIGTAVQQWLSFQGIGTVCFSRRGYGKSCPRSNQYGAPVLIQVMMNDVSEPDTGCMREIFSGHYTMHAAGVLHDQLIRDIRIDKFRRVFSPKYYGSIRQTESGGRLGARGYLLFGSIAAVFGNVGQTSYILANSALEDVASRLSNGGILSSVIHWGPWQIKEGMVTSEIQRSLLQQGVAMLSPLDGLSILQNLVIHHTRTVAQGHHIYCSFDQNGSSFFDRKGDDTVGQRNGPAIAEQQTGAVIMATVIRIATSLIGASSEELKESSRFVDHGLSSLLTAEFAEALNGEFHVGVTSTVVFDYPTVKDLSEFIIAETSRRQRDIVAPNRAASIATMLNKNEMEKPIEIVAQAHRYPTGRMSGEIETVWAEADDFQSTTPPSRWDIDEHFSPASTVGKMYVRFGCWLERVDHFEGHFFGLSPQESLTLDPQIRMLMELSQEVRSKVKLHPYTSSFVGVMYNEYLDAVLGPTSIADEVPSSITTNGMSFMVGRISYHHRVRGKAAAIDTACSSSLVAAHLGYLSAADENGAHSLAHGINLMLSPQTTARICLIKALSPVGRCKTADSTADGYGRSESGCTICMAPVGSEGGVVVLGSNVSHNGASGGLTAPHGRSQANLILSVQSRSYNHGAPAVVSLHGTGTVLGDPIEFGALKTVLAESLPKETQSIYQSLVATKAAMGHTEGNAGLCGLLLPLSNIQRRLLSPIKHLRYINSYIETLQGEKPHRFVRQAAPHFHDEIGPRATYCTNSFGMSGVNAHMMCDLQISGEVWHDATLPSRKTLPWHRTRNWPLPPTPMFPLRHVTTATRRLTFSAGLNRQSLCWIEDHIIERRSILPGSVSLSMFSQALQSVSEDVGSHAISNVAFIRPAPLTTSAYFIHIEGQNIGLRDTRRAMTVAANIGSLVRRIAKVDGLPKSVHVFRSQAPGPKCAASTAVPGSSAPFSACTLDAAMHLALAAWPTGQRRQVPVKLGLYHCISAFADPSISSHKDFRDNTVDVQTKDQSIQGLQSSTVPLLSEESQQQRLPAPTLYARQYLVDIGGTSSTPVSSIDTCILRGEFSMEIGFTEWYAPLEVAKLDGIWPCNALTFIMGGTGNHSRKSDAMQSLASSLAKVISAEISTSTVGYFELPPSSALPRLPGVKFPVGVGDVIVQGRVMATPGYESYYTRPKTTVDHSEIQDQSFGATAVVTGAFGGIGTLVSEWLASHGQHLIRSGRGMPTRPDLNGTGRLSLQTCVKADARFASDLPQLLEGPSSSHLQGMHHTSGVLKDKMLFRANLGDLLQTAAPKCASLDLMLDHANLHRAQYALGYSSISSIIGNAGQLAYTFANRQLNAICSKKRECGMDVAAVAWGPWSGIGMVAHAGLSADSFSTGMRPIAPQEGLALLSAILGPARSSGFIIAGAYDRDLFRASTPSSSQDGGSGTKLDNSTIADERASDRFSSLEDVTLYVTHTIERLLGAPLGMSDNIAGELDSLQSVSAADQLSTALQIEIPPTVLYDYPRLQDLAHHLGSLYVARARSRSPKSTRTLDPSTETQRGRENTRSREPHMTVRTTVPGLTTMETRRPMLPAGYYCRPTIDHIRALSSKDLASVENFVVGREGVGEIRYLYPVDLTEVDLHKSVTITRAGMAIAGTASKEPGQGLNQPAILVFRGTSKKMFRSQNARRLLMSKLRAACDRMGATLVHVDEDAAEWMVKIDCFTIN